MLNVHKRYLNNADKNKKIFSMLKMSKEQRDKMFDELIDDIPLIREEFTVSDRCYGRESKKALRLFPKVDKIIALNNEYIRNSI